MILNHRRFSWLPLVLLLLAGGPCLITDCGPLGATSDTPGAWSIWSTSAKSHQVIVVEASYPGVSAQVLAEGVAGPIEEQVNGVKDLVYMYSRCSQDGKYTLLLRFPPNVDLDLTQVLVQNRVALSLPALPSTVQHHGITVLKQPAGVRLVVTLLSPDGRYDALYLASCSFRQLL